jgi:tRNA A58 N-methylase Trm61
MKKDEIHIFIGDNSAIYPEDAEFMYDTISILPDDGNLLEIGTGYGHSTVFFSQLKPEWTIYTIDGYGEYGSIPQFFSHGQFDIKGLLDTKRYLDSRGLKNIVPIIGNSQDIKWSYPVDTLFIDADHTYEGVKNDFEHFSPFAEIVFLHDYDFPNMAGNGINIFVDELRKSGIWNIETKCHTAKITRK